MRLPLVIILGLFCLPAFADGKVYEGDWNPGAKASFTIKADNIVTYCYLEDPCSDFRNKGTAEKIEIIIPGDYSYPGSFIEFIKQPDGTYFGEYYYGEEATQRIGQNWEGVFKAK